MIQSGRSTTSFGSVLSRSSGRMLRQRPQLMAVARESTAIGHQRRSPLRSDVRDKLPKHFATIARSIAVPAVEPQRDLRAVWLFWWRSAASSEPYIGLQQQTVDWQSSIRRPKRGKTSPTAQERTKQSVLVERTGPLAVVIAGANVVDQKLLEATIEAIVVERPDPKKLEQNLCLTRVYNPTDETQRMAMWPTSAHRGGSSLKRRPGRRKPRRWWWNEPCLLSKCRALLIRYDKNDFNYLINTAACALLWYRR